MKDNLFVEVQELLDSGKKLEEVFDWVGSSYNGFRVVELNYKWNYLDKNNKLLFPDRWLDYCGSFNDGFGAIRLNSKWNYTKPNGEFLSKQWFDYCYDFNEGFAVVRVYAKYNYIKPNGELLSDTWFNTCEDFNHGVGEVELDNKKYIINRNGELYDVQCDSQSPIKSDMLKFLNEKYKHATKDELIGIIASIIECAIGPKNKFIGDLSRIDQVNNKDLETILNNEINDTASKF